ncbi:uncharacterized protein LOC111023930 isoform X2 [Momordica charantia]|uniref:Uncharacterized protein LOC111023930 isoform X2 n=1 Tax=Momordica charantia TaxID=3673 RepID=A0A6J1DTR4_MOMCH|nr:uncharacterized protein LOC111023930 isoform X2 [Momordica charantia]
MEFGVLRKNFDELKDLAEKQETRLRYHESRAHNIAMAYLIWERFFFFGVSQASSSSSSSLLLKCSNWSMVLGLSLSCSFLYFLFFLETLTMLYLAHYHFDIVCKKQIQLCRQILDAVETSIEAGDSSDGFGFSFQVQLGMSSRTKVHGPVE